MNDPQNEPIDQAANDLEGNAYQKEEKLEEEEEQDFMDPRYVSMVKVWGCCDC